MNKIESKCSIVNEKLLQSWSRKENNPKRSIVKKTLSQKCSADENELCSTKEDESECANKKQKDANNEVSCDVTKYFIICNVFECGRTNPEVSYERACMATEHNEYFMDVLDTINKYLDHHGQRLSSKKLKEAVLWVIDEEEEEV